MSGAARRRAVGADPGAPLRILVWHWGRGGAGSKYALELARALEASPGIMVSVAAARGRELALGAEAAGLPVDTVATFEGGRATLAGRASAALAAMRTPLMALRFAGTLRRRRIDVVVCAMQTVWDIAAVPALRAAGVPLLLVLHDATFRDGDRYPMRQRILASEVAAADGVVALTAHVRAQALALHGFRPDRVWTIPHGAFVFGAPPPCPRRLDGRRAARLLFIGRILPYKGLGLLLDAHRRLRAEGVETVLDVLGDGDLSPHRAALAAADHVTITNRWLSEDEIAAALAAADLLVLPYLDASQSGVAAGALAAGLPIVATPVGGLAEQVRHGLTGRVATDVSAAALSEAIRAALSDPEDYAAMSRAALAEADGRLRWDRVASGIAEAATVLATGRRGAGTP